jgi:hypothetical protein
MVKFPYIVDYKLFEKIDLIVAEKLLSEYNDFHVSNRAQMDATLRKSYDAMSSVESEEELAILREQEDHNRCVSESHFKQLFCNPDLTEAVLVGLTIDVDRLTEILLEEFRSRTPITQSALNAIMPRIRCVASVLLFAERIVGGLNKMIVDTADISGDKLNKAVANNEKAELAIEFASDGFVLLLERLQQCEALDVPEFSKHKVALGKIKTVEGYIDFCEKLFFQK